MYAKSPEGVYPLPSPRVGVIQALREINNKSDGVLDHLLPRTQILVTHADSRCDSSEALQGTLHLIQDAFEGKGVQAIVGASCSGASESAALVAGFSNVPLISPSSTSPLLSNNKKYPYFLRVIASDAFSTVAMAGLLYELWHYTSVAIVHSTDPYGSAGGDAFTNAASSYGLTVQTKQTFSEQATQFSVPINALLQAGSRVIVIFCQAFEAARFLKAAYAGGLGGPGFLWLGSDSLLGSDLWLSDHDLATNSSLRYLVFRGLFAFGPTGSMVGNPTYDAYHSRRLQLPRISESSGCLELDDDGQYLWAEDVDGNSSTPPLCKGLDPGNEDRYDVYSYDAAVAIAYALHDLVEVQNRTEIVGADLLDALIYRVHFDGVTGLVDFFEGHPDGLHVGDRETGVQYDLMNFVDNEIGMVSVATWTACASDECQFANQWRWNPVVTLTFSTLDNSQPSQSGSCRYGEVLAQGICTCGIGFSLDDTSLCVPCPVYTSNVGGTSACTLCAAGYYLPLGYAASTDHCKPCPVGADCPWNTTQETLQVQVGYWRLSPYAASIYRCERRGDWTNLNNSACVGGRFAPSACAPGHSGALCQVCLDENQYMVDGLCQDCPDSGIALAGVAIAVLLLVLGGLIFLHEQTGRRFARVSGPLRRLVHNAKIGLRSTGFIAKVKLALTFTQIVAALDTIYSLRLSPAWFRWTGALRFWGDLDVINWFFPPECIAKNVVEKLLLRSLIPLAVVLGMPLLGALLEVAKMIFPGVRNKSSGGRQCKTPPLSSDRNLKLVRRRPSTEAPRTRWQVMFAGALAYTPISLILTFCFTPSVSTRIFESWYCLSFNYGKDVTYNYLATDLSVRCENNDEYDHLISVSWVLIAVWPVGMVAMYAALLFPCREHLQEQSLDTPLVRATEFLHRDYTARCFWWEVVGLLQRTTLSGWLLLVEREPKVIRLLVALVISIAFLILLLAMRPYKRKLDNTMAIGCQILFVCLFLAGLLVRLYEEIISDPQGSPAIAARYLGMASVDDVVVLMILVSLAMLALLLFTVGHEAYSSFIQQRLASKWSVCTMDPPYVHWKPEGIYACFLSHYKMEAASDARYMHDMLRKMLRAPVFLDSSVLSDLRNLITEGVHKSDTMLLLLTKGVLSRPWCLLELLESVRRGIPVVMVQVEHQSVSMAEAHEFLDNFESEMRRINPAGLDFLYKKIGRNLEELVDAVRIILDANQRSPIVFCSHAGDLALVATMKDVIEQMARASGRRLTWKASSTMGTGAANEDRRGVVHGLKLPQFGAPIDGVKKVARRLSCSCSRAHGTDVVNLGGTVFFCCSREDALNHARMIRAQLHTKLGRPCAIGGGSKTASFLDECQLVVVLLTRRLLSDATALFEVWKALQLDHRIVTVAVMGGGYDFDDASKVFLDFESAMDKAGARKELEMRLPKGISIAQMGKKLHDCLMALIALPWTPSGSTNQSDALIDAIVSRLPRKKTTPVSRPHIQAETVSKPRLGVDPLQHGASVMEKGNGNISKNWDVCQQV